MPDAAVSKAASLLHQVAGTAAGLLPDADVVDRVRAKDAQNDDLCGHPQKPTRLAATRNRPLARPGYTW